MSLMGRGRSGPSAGAWRYTAAPPRTRATTPRRFAASTSRRDSATGSRRGTLSGREEEIDVASILGEVHDSAAQHVRGVIAARVEAHRGPDLLGAFGLVDVAVEAGDRLVALDHVPYGLAADGDNAGPAAAYHGAQLGVELGRKVQPRTVGRAVEVDHHLAAGRRAVQDGLEPVGVLLLRVLTLG